MVVEEQYSVVGVLEQRNVSLAVMEAFLPFWFRQSTILQKKKKKQQEMVNHHPEPGKKTRTVLMKRLKLDYDFYQFCLQRLDMQWKSIQNIISIWQKVKWNLLIERRKNVAQVFDQQYKEFENKHLVFSQSWHNHMSGVFPQDDEYMIRLAVAPMNSFILNWHLLVSRKHWCQQFLF